VTPAPAIWNSSASPEQWSCGDAVCRYLHPKEVFISDGILNRGVLAVVGNKNAQDPDDDFRAVKAKQAFDNTGLDFVYPYGATLSVEQKKGVVPILSSGKIAYPMNRPLGAKGQMPVTHAPMVA